MPKPVDTFDKIPPAITPTTASATEQERSPPLPPLRPWPSTSRPDPWPLRSAGCCRPSRPIST